MIFKLGIILTVFVTIPAFILGAVMYLVLERKQGGPEETCYNCNYCVKDFGEWYCVNENSLWFEEEVDLSWEGCSQWESDSK